MTTLGKRIRVTMAGISLALAIGGCSTTDTDTGTADPRPTSDPTAVVTPSRPAIRNDSTYADGVYTATGQYGGAPSSITVTVSLDDDVITDVEVTPHATNPTSLDFQRRFAAAVPAVVVGRPIDEVRVGRLAGSSGTPDGFNAAIQRIKERAR